MCGIAGFKVEEKVAGDIIRKMTDILHHRGPDADGFHSSGPFQGGMRRLVINDLKTGDQPLYNHDGSVVLLYNGEIYNSPQLREELRAKGYTFKTQCDGEVICHLYDECGESLFEKIDGMFAVCLWIEAERKLVLARDIPGEKPLYFSRLSESELVFASEIRSLKQFPGIDLSLNRQAIWDYPTYLWIPEPATVYNAIEVLPKGSYLTADESGIRIKKYRNRFNEGPIGSSDEDVIEETRRVVEEAVKSRLLSDVPVGSFLSGGLDSSIVATIASQNLGRLDTFTIGFEDVHDPYHGTADESGAAAAYAKRLGTRHHAIHVEAKDFLNFLDDFCRYADQPFGVSSGLGLLAIARAAREAGIKVLLSGDGADESFGGYSWYEHLPIKKTTLQAAENISFQNFGMNIEERLENLSRYDAHKRAWAWHYYASEGEKKDLFSPDFFFQKESSLRFFEQYNPSTSWESEDYIRQDREFYLPNEMLRKVDRMTMAYSVEGRPPFVAPAVLAHANKLFYKHMIRKSTLKWVLREAFRGVVPDDILDRPKHGFNVPIDHWLKGEWSFLVDHTFSEDSALSRHGIIHKKSGQIAEKMLNDPDRLNGHSIFTLIMLNKWFEQAET